MADAELLEAARRFCSAVGETEAAAATALLDRAGKVAAAASEIVGSLDVLLQTASTPNIQARPSVRLMHDGRWSVGDAAGARPTHMILLQGWSAEAVLKGLVATPDVAAAAKTDIAAALHIIAPGSRR